MNASPEFGTVLARARAGSGLSQREVAERAGLPQPRISDYERGRRVPPFDRAVDLLEQVGVDVHLEPRPRLEEHDRQLLLMALALTPRERLEQAVRLARLRGAVGRGRVA